MKKIFILFVFAAALVSCNDRVKPSGNIISVERETGEFTGLDIGSGIRTSITMGEEPGLVITADDNIIPYIETYKDGETLIVKVQNHTTIKGDATLKVAVQAVSLNSISGSGGAPLELIGGIAGDQLQVSLSGGSQWKGDIEATDLGITLSGGSQWNGGMIVGTLAATLNGGSGVKTTGGADELALDCSGGSSFNWNDYGFVTDAVTADLSGGSLAKMTIGSSLDANASGGSQLYYMGNPGHVNANTSGGSVVQRVVE